MAGMEVAALSAAVTGMLKIVGNKLASLIIREYSSIVGVKKDLQELQDQVQEINCNLERAEDTALMDAPWLKKLKEVVYDIEDIMDEFQLKAEKQEIDGDSGFVSKCLLIKTAESLLLQCRAAINIKKINKRFAKIVKQRNDLTTIFGHDSGSHMNKKYMNTQTLPICDEASVLGRDQEMHQIISNLVETNGKEEIKVISIVGLGGSGKTTLSKLVFNDNRIIEKHFDVRLWVHVSQEFDIEKLIKKLFEAFGDKDLGQPSLPYMSKRIQEGLSKKKFLVVMDDVWTESQNQWEKIMEYLKAGAPGSRVLLTTRSANVAEVVQSTYQLCLRRLSPDDSWKLFQQSFRMPAKFLESDFIKVGKEIVETCCGLPLAIKVLAGSLGGKELIGEWQAMRDILLDVEGEDSVSACLKLSYFHLPSNLKRCFTMCSLFPKGHVINKQQLIDKWIAHDMISLTPGVDDLEHIGHRYFNSLVQVSFLEVEDEYSVGRVTCKMHDLIHDLARSILCEEISTTVPEDATSSTKGYRFFSLIEPRNFFPRKAFENARAIYIDKGNDIMFGKTFGRTLKNAKHLRSNIIENSIVSTPVLTSIFEVKNLKYLEMSEFQCEALPEAITDAWSLQALYITKSINLLNLPESMGNLKKLRTLNLTLCSKLRCLPDSIGDCQMLSTLDLERCRAFENLPNSIARNKRLRVLRLVSTGIRRLPSSITTLENLEYLRIRGAFQPVTLPEGIGNLTKLKELDLQGNYQSMPPGIGQLTELEKLEMFFVNTDKRYAQISELATLTRISGKLSIRCLKDLTDNSEARQACLKQKEKLHELELSWGSVHDRKNPEHDVVALDGLEPPSGIKQIKITSYAGGRFASWMLNKQASGGVQGHGEFPFLTKMILIDFPKLKHLDGLVQLLCLEELDVAYMPALESISGGPFPLLAKVNLKRLPSLGEVWIGKVGEGCSNQNPHQSGQLQIGSRLTDLHIEGCPKLVVKPHFPVSLEHLLLDNSSNSLLLSSSSSSNSPPAFSHLKVLELWCMKASLPLSRPPSSGLRLELLQHLSTLESLEIFFCRGLFELPKHGNLSQSTGNLTSLQEVKVEHCRAFVQFPESLGVTRPGLKGEPYESESNSELRSLRRFEIGGLPILTCLPESLSHLTSLKELTIANCKVLVQFPDGLGELCSLSKLDISCLPRLTCLPQSLQELQIGLCQALGELPEYLGELHSLRKLKIRGFTIMTCLPQSLCRLAPSLKELEIIDCPKIKSLPEWIKGLDALQRLKILGCPDLERRCEQGNGEDWHLISHIPDLSIG